VATSPFAFPLGVPIFRWFDGNGAPAASYQVQTYVAGTSTPLATYPTYVDGVAGTNANTNPVILDAAGAAQIWVQAAFYKVVILMPVALGGAVVYTQDNVPVAFGYPQPYPTEWVREANTLAYVSANALNVMGVDVTSIYHTGRRIKAQVTAGTVYGTVKSSSFAVNTGVNIQFDSGGTLDAGLSALNYGIISYASPSYLDPRTALSVKLTANQTGFAAATKLAGWTVELDSNNEWSAANNRWVCNYPGKYIVEFQCEFLDTAAGAAVTPQIYKNGSSVRQAASRAFSTVSNITSAVVRYVFTATNNDFIEAFVLGTAATTVQGTNGTVMTIVRLP